MFRSLFFRPSDAPPRAQAPLRRSATAPERLTTSATATDASDLLTPDVARMRPVRASRTAPSTPLRAMSALSSRTASPARSARSRIGDAQLQSARAAHAAAPATDAGLRALIRLTPEALVDAGVCGGHTSAARLLAALRAHGILNQDNHAVRATHTQVLRQALAPLALDATQIERAHDAVTVAHFLFEHATREVPNSFDSELCCGNAFLTRTGSAGNWDAFLTALSNPTRLAASDAALKTAIADLSR